jgi:hypothetical protein
MNISSKITIKETLSNKNNNRLIFALISSDINTRNKKEQKGKLSFMKKYSFIFLNIIMDKHASINPMKKIKNNLTLLFITIIKRTNKQTIDSLLLLLIKAPMHLDLEKINQDRIGELPPLVTYGGL